MEQYYNVLSAMLIYSLCLEIGSKWVSFCYKLSKSFQIFASTSCQQDGP